MSPSTPSVERGSASPQRRDAAPDPHVPLRLSVTRGALGLELYEPVEVGPLTVAALSLRLPNLKFPLDLTGGVREFRHRRGELERLEVTLGLSRLERFIEPRARQVLNGPARAQVWALEQGLGVGVTGPTAALAFDLLWAPAQADARLVLVNARAAGLAGSALGHALRLVDSVLGGYAVRRGRELWFVRPASRLTRTVLPAIGARAPAASGARCGPLEVNGDTLTLGLDAAALPPALTDAACRAVELALLVADADDALARGDLEAARAGYVQALERAPRHPTLCRLVAEIDVAVGGRAEAALGMLVEAVAAVHGGPLAGDLLALTGDLAAARAAYAEAARDEPFGPVAALHFVRLAGFETEPRQRLHALDEAVARAPALEPVRWARFDARLALRDVEGALADAQHVEASVQGSRPRHEACLRAGRALFEAGLARDAGRLYERALRYVPDDPAATAGLARSLVAAGRAARAFALFERAIELSERRGAPDPSALLELAKLLANEYRDLPQAIARATQVDISAREAVEARALEARWRAAVGDVAGASLAYARLRDTVAHFTPADPAHARWLLDAARFERVTQGDALAAERHGAVALRVAPHDPLVQRTYRELAAVVAAEARARRAGGEESSGVPSDPFEAQVGGAAPRGASASPAERVAVVDAQVAPVAALPAALAASAPDGAETSSLDLELLEEEAQRLEGALRADPGATAIALRLVVVLERLGKDQELFALVAARLEDAEPVEQEQLLPAARAVVGRLAAAARSAGRGQEAEIYDAMLRRYA